MSGAKATVTVVATISVKDNPSLGFEMCQTDGLNLEMPFRCKRLAGEK